MAKQPSKKPKLSDKIRTWKKRFKNRNQNHIVLHRSFRRSYREDYWRDLEVPGIFQHIVLTFKIIFKNWKLFLPLWFLAVFLMIFLIGLMSEDTYLEFQNTIDETSNEIAGGNLGNVARAGLVLLSTVTTGGLSDFSSEANIVFFILIFLLIWLTTIFILRHRLANNKIKLRDALYNSMTPFISTFLVFLVIIIQCIPIFILIVVGSAAIKTGFLSAPFYALLFFIFASLMVLLSGYLLSSSAIALISVSAPGLYPMKALKTASDLMAGRRFRFILRLIALVFVLAVIWVACLIPLILLDFWLKSIAGWLEGVPFISFCLLTMTCFSLIYMTAYVYLYYRWMLDYEDDYLERHPAEEKIKKPKKKLLKHRTRSKNGKK